MVWVLAPVVKVGPVENEAELAPITVVYGPEIEAGDAFHW